uniref:Putative galactoside-binding lectin n=1 Tax=Panstrongylus lignarius TaxID=156445 RepID=A0A224XW65_9HEMI
MSISGLLVLMVFLQTVSTEELEETVCQDEIAELDCPSGHTVQVKTAMFGRTDKRICKRRNIPNPDNCTAPNTLSIMQEKCNLKQSCRVHATTNLFGDPCNHFSYLRVTYTCPTNYEFLRIIRCEHEVSEIECPEQQKIKIMNVLYGRKNQHTCHPTEFSMNAALETNNCASKSASDVVENMCNGLNNCRVWVESVQFNKDDGCPTTFKYLEIDYLCVD